MIKIKATNMELTEAISDYVNKKVLSFEKLINKDSAIVSVEVGKTTKHHNKGEVFRAEFDIKTDGNKFYSSSEKEDLYSAIDDAKEEIVRKITRNKDRKQTLFKRGALSIKKMVKGLSKRNPFSSKY